MNIVPFGLPWEAPGLRVERLAEAVQVIRALWLSARDKPVRFNGQFYKLENAFLTQRPKQKPMPPIYVGVFASKKGLEVAGRYGDGWHSWLNTPDLFRKRWALVKEAAEAAGRSPSSVDNTSHLMVAFPRNAKEKKNAIIAGKATLIMEKTLLKSLGHTPETTDYQNLVSCSQEQVDMILHAAEAVPDEILYRTAAIGEIEDVKVRVEELRRAGVKHYAILDLLAPRGIKRTLDLFRKIIRDYK
jgi:phthiodiolone/phenolphthiodiolone dimycocerosates ketoreductase